MIAAETGKWQLAELLGACGEAGIPAGPINPIDAVFADPQVRERGMRIELDGIAAKYADDGSLQITVPRRARPEPRRIPIG